MRRRTVLWAMAAAAFGGCGGDKETATSEPVRPAHTDEACIETWNADARLGTAGQKTPADYLAELAADGRALAQALYFKGDCVVIAPVAPESRRVYIFAARGGRAPFGLPSQSKLPAGRSLNINVEADEKGRLAPVGGR